jgi:isopentenyl-diphosphate delta-isomerase type 1
MQTTDNGNELFYRVDENDNEIGKVKRGDAHSNPSIIHRTMHVVLFNSKGEILLQLRSLTKDKYPGYWTEAATGHVRYGSDYLSTAVTEIREELGLDVKPEDLTEMAKLLEKNEYESEFVTVFKLQLRGETIQFNLNPEEVSEVKFFSVKEIRRMLKNPEIKFTPVTRIIHEQFL